MGKKAQSDDGGRCKKPTKGRKESFTVEDTGNQDEVRVSGRGQD